MKAINNIEEYRQLNKLTPYHFEAGDVLIKKVFKGYEHCMVEKLIVQGQKPFSGPEKIKSEYGKYSFRNNGSTTSEHAAIMVSNNDMAETIGEGLVTGSLISRSTEKYIVYRCLDSSLLKGAIEIAKRLSGYNSNKEFIRGKYNLKGAFVSNFRNKYFNASSNAFYTDVINFAYGLTNKQPDLFCSQFAILCYEAASIAAYGKTCMGSDPRAISPIRLEDNLNNRQDLFYRLGSFDYDDRTELQTLNKAIADYESKKSMFYQSNATKLILNKIPIILQKDSDQYITEFVGYILGNPFLPKDKYHYFRKNYGKDFILNKSSTLYQVMMKHFSNLSATLSSNTGSVS